MPNEVKEELVPCEVCGHLVLRNERGFYHDCPNCGWRRGCDNSAMEQQLHISYPMVVSLSHAKKQYRQGVPFKADFNEFIRALLFYGEMQFDHKGATYCVVAYRDPDGALINITLCGETTRQEFRSAEEFKEQAHINGKKVKNIWDEINDPRYM